MTVRVTRAVDADQAEVRARLAVAGLRPSEAWLSWRLSAPHTERWVAMGEKDSIGLVEMGSLRTARGPREVALWIAGGGPTDEIVLLHRALAEALGPEIAWLGLGAGPPVPGMTRRGRFPMWVTGPDPFVSVQPRFWSFRPEHVDIANADGDLGLLRTAEELTWRYIERPDAELILMETDDGGGTSGWMAVELSRRRGVAAVEVRELHARNRRDHYALLKAARRLSWDRGGRPVLLRGSPMSRRYALTAGYVPRPGAPHLWALGRVPDGEWGVADWRR